MIKNLIRIIITIPTFVLFLLLNVAVMAQSTPASPDKPDEGDRRDTGHPHPQKHPDEHMKNKPESTSGAKTTPPSPAEEKPSGSDDMDKKKSPATGTGGSSGY